MQPSYTCCINHRAAHTGCVGDETKAASFSFLLCFQEEILTFYDSYVQIHLRLSSRTALNPPHAFTLTLITFTNSPKGKAIIPSWDP